MNLDPECSQAYIGKLLAEERTVNLMALAQKRIEENEKAETQLLILELSDEDGDDIECQRAAAEEEANAQYMITGYLSAAEIRAIFRINELEYHSEVACREEQLDNEEWYWEDHRELKRALKYADAQAKREIETARSLAISVAKERLEKAIAEDKANKNNLHVAYEVHMQEAKHAVANAYEAAIKRQEAECAAQYENACKRMHAAKTLHDYRAVAGIFMKIYSYRDSAEKVKICNKYEAELADIQKQRQTLTKEMATLMSERNCLGIFATKRKKEIDARIEEIKTQLG